MAGGKAAAIVGIGTPAKTRGKATTVLAETMVIERTVIEMMVVGTILVGTMFAEMIVAGTTLIGTMVAGTAVASHVTNRQKAHRGQVVAASALPLETTGTKVERK